MMMGKWWSWPHKPGLIRTCQFLKPLTHKKVIYNFQSLVTISLTGLGFALLNLFWDVIITLTYSCGCKTAPWQRNLRGKCRAHFALTEVFFLTLGYYTNACWRTSDNFSAANSGMTEWQALRVMFMWLTSVICDNVHPASLEILHPNYF